ncbi:uncharacterized protein LOC113237706 [Hyposmocoma kahamanoa]|uniref:uncharacterized protein LOC113237706 n=1 Tax=Hyposmocoma kahamanoa TaxID=1477025 RepID=UPI000E6D9563|nr:uncharacterized protein LOC113237706 [Hyposmocoma kahamanoa]
MAHEPDSIYKALRLVPDFDGNPNILTRFIRLCDQIVHTYMSNTPGSELSNLCLLNGILNKITGTASCTINSNGIPDSWVGIRTALINNFSDQCDETTLYNDHSLFTITNDKDEIKGHPLKLTKIPYDVMKQVATPSHVHLKSIDLKGLHNVQSKLLVEPPLTLDTNETNVLYHTTIPLYVIITGACALVIAIRSRRRNLWNCKLRNAQEAKPTFNQTLEDPEKAENHIEGLPAIFSLNVRK